MTFSKIFLSNDPLILDQRLNWDELALDILRELDHYWIVLRYEPCPWCP